MSRASCSQCSRPQKTCICHLFCNIENTIHIVVLQHPTEVTQTKGTVTLLSNSLNNCSVFVGEEFNDNEALKELLCRHQHKTCLLYPSDNATVLSGELNNEIITNNAEGSAALPSLIILLDGTWKKSYKMYMLNTFLHTLPHITLPEGTQGDYAIRKTQKANALSSLEACTYALMMLESNQNKYQPLLTNFKAFNDLQLAFRR